MDAKYGLYLAREIFRGGLHGISCYDMLMSIMPGRLGVAALLLFNGLAVLTCLAHPTAAGAAVQTMAGTVLAAAGIGYYAVMLLCGLITILTEWRRIPATAGQKLRYLPLFPIFMLTYLPIAITALFRKVEWKPIRHTPEPEPEVKRV